MDLIETLEHELEELIIADKIILPTLPEMAIKVRDAVENPHFTLQSLADILTQDAALTARLIRIANSPLMRGIVKVDNLMLALNRLGINYVQNITTGLAMEQIFQATNELIDTRLRKTWAHSKEVSAIAATFAKEYTRLPIDKIALAGLVHEIGVLPILSFLETHHQEITDATLLESILAKLQQKIGSTILKVWQFPPELIAVPLEYLNFTRKTNSQQADYIDIILIANLQTLKKNDTFYNSLDLKQISAFERLGISPDFDMLQNESFMEQLKILRDIYN